MNETQNRYRVAKTADDLAMIAGKLLENYKFLSNSEINILRLALTGKYPKIKKIYIYLRYIDETDETPEFYGREKLTKEELEDVQKRVEKFTAAQLGVKLHTEYLSHTLYEDLDAIYVNINCLYRCIHHSFISYYKHRVTGCSDDGEKLRQAEYKLQCILYKFYNGIPINSPKKITDEELQVFIDKINKNGLSINDIKYFIKNNDQFNIEVYDQFYTLLYTQDKPLVRWTMRVMIKEDHAILLSEKDVNINIKRISDGTGDESAHNIKQHIKELVEENKKTFIYKDQKTVREIIDMMVEENKGGKFILEFFCTSTQVKELLLNDKMYCNNKIRFARDREIRQDVIHSIQKSGIKNKTKYTIICIVKDIVDNDEFVKFNEIVEHKSQLDYQYALNEITHVIHSVVLNKRTLSINSEFQDYVRDTIKIRPDVFYTTAFFNKFHSEVNDDKRELNAKEYVQFDVNKFYTWIMINLKKVPIFETFDKWYIYEDQPIQDLYQYIIITSEDRIYEGTSLDIENNYRRQLVRCYGIEINTLKKLGYDVIVRYFRTSETHDWLTESRFLEDFARNKNYRVQDKKMVCNVVSGLLEKKHKKITELAVYDKFENAKAYQVEHGFKQMKTHMITNFDPDVEDDDSDNKYKEKTLYILKKNTKVKMQETHNPIKELIYSYCKIFWLNLFDELDKNDIEICGLKTDALIIHSSQRDKLIELLGDRINDDIGGFKIVDDMKNFVCHPYIRTNFEMPEIKTRHFGKLNKYTFGKNIDDKQLLNLNNFTLFEATAGSGKTTLCCKRIRKLLNVKPEETLYLSPNHNLKTDKAIEYGKIHHQTFHAGYHMIIKGGYKLVVMDEIHLLDKTTLARFMRYWSKIPKEDKADIKIFACGEISQLKSYDNVDKTILLNALFKTRVELTHNYRNAQITKAKSLIYDENTKWDTYKNKAKLINKLKDEFGINVISQQQYTEYITEDYMDIVNATLSNNKCIELENIVFEMRGTKSYIVGDTLISHVTESRCIEGKKPEIDENGKKKKIPKVDIHKSLKYKIVKIVKHESDEKEDEYYLKHINAPEDEIFKVSYHHIMSKQNGRRNYHLANSATIYSIQGSTISKDLFVFNALHKFFTKRHLYTAITRAKDFTKVYIVIDKDEHKRTENYDIYSYMAQKRKNYIHQDLVSKRMIMPEKEDDEKGVCIEVVDKLGDKTKTNITERQLQQKYYKTYVYDEEDYISVKEMIKLFNNSKCVTCNCDFYMDNIDDNYCSNFSLDRINNFDCHTSDNLYPCCVECNVKSK